MLRQFFRKLFGRKQESPPFDPTEYFEDPVAGETQWTSMARVGTNFCTHKLVAVSMNRMEFRATIGALLFAGAFVLGGIGALAFLVGALGKGTDDWTLIPFLGGFALVFGGGGVWMLRRSTSPIVFDNRAGYFWRGRRSPELKAPTDDDDSAVSLDRIHALQIISQYCSGSESSYYTYELNLVLNDGRRLHVLGHGKAHKLYADADELAEFLDVPVWDAPD